MTVITSKQQQRIGNLVDLPVGPLNGLLPGEFGYATDVQRLFIGNQPITIACDGVATQFTFNVDLNSMWQGSYRLYHTPTGGDAVDITSTIQFTDTQDITVNDVAGSIVVLSAAPAEGEITLYYNTELDTFTPDQSYDASYSRELAAAATPETTHVLIPLTRYKKVKLDYSLEDGNGFYRTGTLHISPLGTTDVLIKDEHDTNAVAGELDHEFSVEVNGDNMELKYTSSDVAGFTWIEAHVNQPSGA